jgi:hypothetical protein
MLFSQYVKHNTCFIICFKTVGLHLKVTNCYVVPIRLPASLCTRDQSTPVVLAFDYHTVVTRIALSIGATLAPLPASRAAAHHSVHVGLTTPHRARIYEDYSKTPTQGEAATYVLPPGSMSHNIYVDDSCLFCG